MPALGRPMWKHDPACMSVWLLGCSATLKKDYVDPVVLSSTEIRTALSSGSSSGMQVGIQG